MWNRNNKRLRSACAAALAAIVALALLGAAWQPETEIVEEMLHQRTHIMENVLAGKLSYDAGKEQLKEIETGKLLNDDLENLLASEETDIDRVKKMEVLHIERTSRMYDRMSFQASIYWTCNGLSGKYEETAEYHVGVSKSAGKYKLISLKLQEAEH